MTPTSHLGNCWTKDFPECLIGWYWAWRRRKLLWHQSSTSWFSLLSNWGPVEKKGAQHGGCFVDFLRYSVHNAIALAVLVDTAQEQTQHKRSSHWVLTLAQFTPGAFLELSLQLWSATKVWPDLRSTQPGPRRHTHNNYFKTYYAYASFSVLVSRYLGHWETLFYRLIPITSKKIKCHSRSQSE